MTSAFVTVNGIGAISAHIVRPRVGAWHAEIRIDATTADRFTGSVSIVVAETITLVGTAWRVGAHHGSVYLRAVGGGGGLSRQLSPASWQNVPLQIPLQNALAAVGEALSPTVDPSLLSTLLPKWSRPARGAGVEVAALVAALPGAVWRVLPDGSIWLGKESWGSASIDYQEIEFQPSIGRLEIASDVPTVAPGQTLPAPDGSPYDGFRVSSVEHFVSESEIRHVLTFEDAGTVDAGTDRLTRGLTRFVQSVVSAKMDALALYPSKVIAQNADGTLELQPDDTRWPGFSRVPIRLGIPGATVKLTAGRVLLGFAGGDPQKPIAELWEGGATVTEISLAGGAQFVALGQDVRDELDDIRAKFLSHTHLLTIAAASGSGGTGTAAVTTTTLAAAKAVKSTKVKAT